MGERLKVDLPVVVEGRYDKSTLSSVIDGKIITLGGFSVFNSKEKQALIRLISKDGIIILTDSDGGGKQIRAFLNGIIPKEKIYNLYVPAIKGKEKRKSAPSKAGLLGVEGMPAELLRELFLPFSHRGRAELFGEKPSAQLTKVDLFTAGLSGGDGSKERRRILAEHLGLPGDMTANALLDALNIICTREEYEKAVRELFNENR